MNKDQSTHLVIFLWYKLDLFESGNGSVWAAVLGIKSCSKHLVSVVFSCENIIELCVRYIK